MTLIREYNEIVEQGKKFAYILGYMMRHADVFDEKIMLYVDNRDDTTWFIFTMYLQEVFPESAFELYSYSSGAQTVIFEMSNKEISFLLFLFNNFDALWERLRNDSAYYFFVGFFAPEHSKPVHVSTSVAAGLVKLSKRAGLKVIPKVAKSGGVWVSCLFNE